MASREDIGSWLDGGATPGGGGADRLGLPREGSGSMASLGRRVVALMVDWAIALAISALVPGGNDFVPLLVLAAMNVVLVGSVGYTIGYRLLGLQVYFTAGEKEVRAWEIPVGAKAPQAAGVIHTDFERGFIRAETVAYDDFVQHRGWKGAREKGAVRSEGKEYVVQDGDVLLFRFNV